MNKAYTFYHDGHHGWLVVPFEDLCELGIEGEISCYSSMNRFMAYLEEDSDAEHFIEAYAKKYGVEPTERSRYIDSDSNPIMNYSSYSDMDLKEKEAARKHWRDR